MFDPNLVQREKAIDRQEAVARAQQFRLAQQASRQRPAGRWHLAARLDAAVRALGCSAALRRLGSRLEGLAAGRATWLGALEALFHDRVVAVAPCQDEAKG
jgi:hypothetical protein